MTEAEWLTCDDPRAMFGCLKDWQVPDRKLRLFVCGWSRNRWESLDEWGRKGVQVSEAYADGLVKAKAVQEVIEASPDGHLNILLDQPWNEALGIVWEEGTADERRTTCSLLRDIFNNPFNPIPLDTSWLVPAVVKFAETIYHDRTFDRMPELAEALERAGCTNQEILDHCRGPGPHVRGCWVIDLLLAKS